MHSADAGKEYAKADSRYATRDDFVISMEAVTAFIEGPACLFIVWGMLTQKPWRLITIVMVSLGQLYGDVLYFGTCFHGGEDLAKSAMLLIMRLGLMQCCLVLLLTARLLQHPGTQPYRCALCVRYC